MTWTWGASESIAAASLVVAAAGFVVSVLSYRKASKLDAPTAWAEVLGIGAEDCWAVNICLRNPTKYDVKLNALNVPIEQVPIDSKRAFMLASYDEAMKAADNKVENLPIVLSKSDWHMKMPLPASAPIISSGATGSVRAFIKRGQLSSTSKVKVGLFYTILMESPKSVRRDILVTLPPSSLIISVART